MFTGAKSAEDGWSDMPWIKAQMHVRFAAPCRDEALIVVRNSAKGLTAWRRLNREYEPNSEVANLLQAGSASDAKARRTSVRRARNLRVWVSHVQ